MFMLGMLGLVFWCIDALDLTTLIDPGIIALPLELARDNCERSSVILALSTDSFAAFKGEIRFYEVYRV